VGGVALRRVLKYTIPRESLHQPVNVPMAPGAQVLSVAVESMRPILYAVGDGEATEPRWFQALWTRDPWPDGARFVGTVRMAGPDGHVVWHVVELPDQNKE